MKLYGRAVSPVPAVGWFATPWLQVAAAEWELVLGLWLLGGSARHGAWWAAVGTFAAFAVVSACLGWQGVASCGCFGTIEASPWWAFGVDFTALALLAVGRPQPSARSSEREAGLSATVLVAGVLLALATLLGTALYGSPAAALARLRGDSMLASPGMIDFGPCQPGEIREGTLRVRNLLDRPVRLVGGTSDCSCVTTSSLPLTIPPGEVVEVAVIFKAPATDGVLTRRAELWTDCDNQRTIGLALTSRLERPAGVVPAGR